MVVVLPSPAAGLADHHVGFVVGVTYMERSMVKCPHPIPHRCVQVMMVEAYGLTQHASLELGSSSKTGTRTVFDQACYGNFEITGIDFGRT